MIQTFNPYNNSLLANYEWDTDAQIQEKLAYAVNGRHHWNHLSIDQKSEYLQKLAQYLIDHAKELGAIATLEMGKPLQQSIAEIEKCALALNYYADNSKALLKPQYIATEYSESFVSMQPIGTVLAIMPWNFPYWQVFRAMGPILMAGNSMLLKHASNVTGCGKAIAQAMEVVGFPPYVFQQLIIDNKSVESVIAHPTVQAVTFTGSTTVGSLIASIAGKHLKKQVLELGGSDAYIICEDADLDLAAEKCSQSRLNNTGQSCIGAKRFIVDKKVAVAFTEKMKAIFETKLWGNPIENPSIGTLAKKDFRDDLHKQVMESVALGATIEIGGFIPNEEGAFYPPTILSNVHEGMPAYHEELFGPVASIIIAEDTSDAIRIANDSEFGLGGGIFSKDIDHARVIATQFIHAGSVAINTFVSSDPRLPFGGIRKSGYGRELGKFGLYEFCNIKTLAIQ